MRTFRISICIILIFSMLFCFAGCGGAGESKEADVVNLSENIEPVEVKRQKLSDDFIVAQQDFALKVFATESKKHQGNLNISPYSLSFALGIVAGGAEGETLNQFEAVLMNGMSREEWNNNMYSYLRQNNTLTQADSLWIAKKETAVKEGFLQNALGNFGASVYYVNFGSEGAVQEINRWVKENTNGKIESIADEFDEATAMYVANAVYMDKPWSSSHSEKNVTEEEFICANGEKSTVKMMYSVIDSYKETYISDENAEGFIKGCSADYKFVALMPNEGVDINDYIADLNGSRLRSILLNGERVMLKTGMPYFTIESSIDFRESLVEMGVRNAYSASDADFTGILDNNSLYMGKTIQKTYINVDIGGIRAASATGQELIYMSGLTKEEKVLVLNRPFVYIILDQNNIPVFIGTVTQL